VEARVDYRQDGSGMTIGIWFQQQALLVLIDQDSVLAEKHESTSSPEPTWRLVAIRSPNSEGTAGAKSASTSLAPWPPLQSRHIPMVLPCNKDGIELRVYCCDNKGADAFDPVSEGFTCDSRTALENSEHWWVLTWSEQIMDPSGTDRPFDMAVLVERSDLSGTSANAAAYGIIEAARSKAPRMRRSAVYVVSPISGRRLGAATVVSYAPSQSALRITFQLESTRSGTTQPKAIIDGLASTKLSDALANLCVFQFHRAGRACSSPELSFGGLGRDAHRVSQGRVSTPFFPPVRTGDVIGILARGVHLQPPPGSQATTIDLFHWREPAGNQVQMTVRQEDGFIPVGDDMELLQSGRLADLTRLLKSACPVMNEERLVDWLLGWTRFRVDQIAQETVARLKDSWLRSRAQLALQLANRQDRLGYLLYTVSSAEALRDRVETRKRVDEPWLTVQGVPDRERVAELCNSFLHSGSAEQPDQ
jgi:hypothetical protein